MSVSKQSIAKFLSKEFHPTQRTRCVIGEVTKDGAVITCELESTDLFTKENLMIAADFALQSAILGKLGRVQSLVMTNMNINFLHQPRKTSEIVAECQFVQTNKLFFMGDVLLYSSSLKKPIAHVVGSYTGTVNNI